jgi:hypothetical protein
VYDKKRGLTPYLKFVDIRLSQHHLFKRWAFLNCPGQKIKILVFCYACILGFIIDKYEYETLLLSILSASLRLKLFRGREGQVFLIFPHPLTTSCVSDTLWTTEWVSISSKNSANKNVREQSREPMRMWANTPPHQSREPMRMWMNTLSCQSSVPQVLVLSSRHLCYTKQII